MWGWFLYFSIQVRYGLKHTYIKENNILQYIYFNSFLAVFTTKMKTITFYNHSTNILIHIIIKCNLTFNSIQRLGWDYRQYPVPISFVNFRFNSPFSDEYSTGKFLVQRRQVKKKGSINQFFFLFTFLGSIVFFLYTILLYSKFIVYFFDGDRVFF